MSFGGIQIYPSASVNAAKYFQLICDKLLFFRQVNIYRSFAVAETARFTEGKFNIVILFLARLVNLFPNFRREFENVNDWLMTNFANIPMKSWQTMCMNFPYSLFVVDEGVEIDPSKLSRCS